MYQLHIVSERMRKAKVGLQVIIAIAKSIPMKEEVNHQW